MKTRSQGRQLGMLRPPQHKPSQQPAHAPVLQLPQLALRQIVTCLGADDRCSLRLACKAAEALVSASLTQLTVQLEDLYSDPSLPQRFCSVSTLKLVTLPLDTSPADCNCADCYYEDHGRGAGVPTPKPPPRNAAPWPNVTSMITDARDGAAVAALQLCSNVERFSSERACALCLPALCKQLARLPRLTSIHAPCACVGHYLPSLKHCTALRELTGIMYLEGAALDWVLLLGMRHLVTLHMYNDWITNEALSDFSRLSNLQHLKLAFPDHMGAEDAELVATFDTLQLPPSLLSLSMPHVPLAALEATPHLTSLALDTSIGEKQLASLAGTCSALSSLRLQRLALTPACHTAPLKALTQLSVLREFGTKKGVSLARVFPALQSLSLIFGGCASPPKGPSLFAGLTALQCLDVGPDWYEWDRDEQLHPQLLPCDFDALSALPALQHLRIRVHPTHLQQLRQLAQLRSVVLVLEHLYTGAGDDSQDPVEIEDAFARHGPPPQLRSMVIEIGHRDAYQETPVGACMGLCKEVVGWAARAPVLESLRWFAPFFAEEVAMTPALLHALVERSPSIRRVICTPDADNSPDEPQWPAAMHEAATWLAARGVEVVLDGAREEGAW